MSAKAKTRSFKSDAPSTAFLLGGIGTGNVSIGSRGELRDWEICNRPEKGAYLPYTGFYLWAKPEGGRPMVRVLEAQLSGPHNNSHGYESSALAGLPRFADSIMRAEYPFVNVEFKEKGLPLSVAFEAFTPFVPLDADASSYPAAILRYRVTNTSKKPIDVSIAGSLMNLTGSVRDYTNIWGKHWCHIKTEKQNRNEFRDEGGLRGLWCTAPEVASDSTTFGSMALVTDMTGVTAKPTWLDGGWWDGAHDFWDDFSDDGELSGASYGTLDVSEKAPTPAKIGALAVKRRLKPGETKGFQFILAWHFPNRIKKWEDKHVVASGDQVVRNHFATLFTDAWDVADKLRSELPRLEKLSREFRRALFASTLPSYVIDAMASNITVLRSPTCFRLENGIFTGWEGCHDSGGSCDGSCTHVWNYAQTVAFLFPELEQTMRRVEFGLETDESGKMAYRTHRIFDPNDKFGDHAAADGQNGTIMRLYRDWRLSGNNDLIRDLWPHVRDSLNYAFEFWDSDKDGVLDSRQHNTYDIEFYGPNSLVNSLFFGALKAGVEMAKFMADDKQAQTWQAAFDHGNVLMDTMLWNGEYYVQKLDDVNKYRYQYGEGCLSDQVFGQMIAHLTDLGYVLPKEHVRKAIESVYKYNFKSSLKNHQNVQRGYGLNDEAGLLLASWPKGGRPRFPFVYADEVWTGIEYQVAAHLIYEGMVKEGLSVVKAVRDRHDGYRRNPFNEVECGHHYARSMASWALLPALSGYRYDMRKNEIGFSPAVNKTDFASFFSTGKQWGIFTQKKNARGKLVQKIEILFGDKKNPPRLM